MAAVMDSEKTRMLLLVVGGIDELPSREPWDKHVPLSTRPCLEVCGYVDGQAALGLFRAPRLFTSLATTGMPWPPQVGV